MMILSVDTEEHYNLDYTKGELHIVENSTFRIALLIVEGGDKAIILSIGESQQ